MSKLNVSPPKGAPFLIPCLYTYDGYARPVLIGVWTKGYKPFGDQHCRLVDFSKYPPVDISFAEDYLKYAYFGNIVEYMDPADLANAFGDINNNQEPMEE
uniref:Uncharacterized protein n=2 Tax=Panagrolaimus sp. JU765 TaxID=591449 RepID=A0AC34R383_9BILA